MEYPTAAAARQAFAAAAAGDIAPALDLMHDDFLIVNDIGAGPWGEVRGKDAVLAFWTRWAELFDGSFSQEVTDVIGYDDRVVMLVHERGVAAGTPFDNRAVYLIELRGDKWSALRTLDMDRDNCQRFWATVDFPATTAS